MKAKVVPLNAIAPASPDTEVEHLLNLQRADFLQEGHVSAEVRIERLNRAIDLIYDNQNAIVEALSKDFGSRARQHSIFSDVYFCLESLKFSRQHLRQWMKTERRSLNLIYRLSGSRAEIRYQPKGVIAILGTWNFPVNTVFCPLAGVLAAGNRAVLKFSETTPHTAALMDSLVASYFDPKVVTTISGGPETGASITSAPFDHLVFTGSSAVGRHIMKAASEHLTPVTLELGGKSPVILDKNIDLREAAERIMIGKALNSGQVCLSPDYAFVPAESLESFVQNACESIQTLFPSLKNNQDYTAIINERHYQRLHFAIEEAREKGASVYQINPANEALEPADGVYKLPMTFIINPQDDLAIMQEEIFGPVLVVKSYQNIEECIDYINSRPRPLGLYCFSNREAFQQEVLSRTLSGGVTLNDVISHGGCENVPFGGVGASGIGHYHGHFGFKEFSHARSVFKQGKINIQKLSGLIPPYKEKCDKALKAMVKK